MFLALARRTFLFLAFLLFVSFAVVFVHKLIEKEPYSMAAAVGAGATVAVMAVCCIGMVKTDDYLTPLHTRIFFLITAVIAGTLGLGLLIFFTVSNDYPASFLRSFGAVPAGIAAVYLFIAFTRIKEAYSLPAEYRPEGKRLVGAVLPLGVSIPALAVASVAALFTIKDLDVSTGLPDSVFEESENGDPVEDTSREVRAEEIFQLAKQAQRENGYRGSFDLFQQAADLGHAEAHYELALIYSGKGFLQDSGKAREHFEQAAEIGHLESTFRLGKAYRHGELGLKPDYAKARAYLEKAATEGHLDSQTQLGHLYNRGEGVEADHEAAFHWFLKAAEQGDPVAQNDVGIFYLNGTGTEKNTEKGIEWLTRAAEQGVAVAEYNLGRALYTGEIVAKDLDKAHTYFKRLADKEIPFGFQMIGLQYLHGQGSPKDENAAFEAFAEGAARGDTISQYYLGYCYLEGLGTEKNSSAALHYLGQAAAKNHPEAQLLLGHLNLGGTVILQDSLEAAKWFELAAQNGSEEAASELADLEAELTPDELAQVDERIAAFEYKPTE